MFAFLNGCRYFISGYKLIFRPELRYFVIVPVLINIILFVGLFFVLQHYLQVFNAWFASYLPVWLQFLTAFFWLLFICSFFLLFIYTFVTLANLIAAPFNSLLAEKVEFYLTGKVPAARGLLDHIKDTPHILGRQLAVIAYYVPRALFLLLLFFVPVIQVFVPFFWLLFNAWFLAFTYLDYPSDNHRIPLATLHVWLKQKPGLAWGLGMSILTTSLVPVLNFFTVPAAVAAATQLWLQETRERE